MSLETSLELNNQLLTKNNALFEQLLSVLDAQGRGVRADVDNAPATKVCHESAADDTGDASPDIESLDIRTITTLANLFGADAKNLTAEQVGKAQMVKRNKFTDALSLALLDCKAVKNAPRAVILDLCIVMLAHWSAMATIDERRAFAELYIKTPYNKRAGLAPQQAEPEATPEPEVASAEQDTAALFEQARTLVMKLTTGGYRNEAVEILNKFGAQKLGQVPREKLADVVMLAEQALGEG